jgi:hypothetical protein
MTRSFQNPWTTPAKTHANSREAFKFRKKLRVVVGTSRRFSGRPLFESLVFVPYDAKPATVSPESSKPSAFWLCDDFDDLSG